MSHAHPHSSTSHRLAACAVVLAAVWLSQIAPALAASPYPAAAQRPAKVARASEFASPTKNARQASAGGTSAGGTTPATTPSASTKSTAKKPAAAKPKKPKLPVNAERAQLAFEVMQKTYYIEGSGLYKGEPFSFLWPFSQALAASVSMANIPSLKSSFGPEIRARLVGLKSYLDLDNSGAPEGTYSSTLAAYDGTVGAPGRAGRG